MRKNDWDTLIWSLQRQNCILFLGPAIYSTGEDNSPVHLSQQLAAELASELDKGVSSHTDLPAVAQCYAEAFSRLDLSVAARRFYRTHMSDRSEILVSVAALPFYLAVSSCHDNLLVSAFSEAGKTPQMEFYNFRGATPANLRMGTIESPLVYQLYGSVEDPSSLVLTDFDLIDFLVAIVSKAPALPQSITAELQKSGKSVLFLGFGIRQWYLRILLHVLRSASADSRSFALEVLHRVTSEAAPETSPILDERTVLFYKKGYKLEIFNDDVAEFVKELHERYAAAGGLAPSVPRNSAVPDLPPPKLFISYAHKNDDFVRKVCEELRNARLEPWMDTVSLEAGDGWASVIKDRVNDADYFLVFQSKALLTENFSYVNLEVKLALNKQLTARQGTRFIIPLQIDTTEVLPELRDIQSVPLQDASQVSSLVSVIFRDYQRRSRQ